MNILSIGLDRALFEKKSDTFWRVSTYASWFNNYTTIVTTLKKGKKEEFKLKSLKVIPTNSVSRFLYPLDILKIALKLKEEKFDVVTVQDPFICAIAGILVKFFLKIPLNIQIHSDFFSSGYFRNESVFNRILYYVGLVTVQFADTIRARNNRIKHHIIETFPKFKNKVSYVGVKINEAYLSKLSIKKRDQNLIIANSRLVPQKNLPLMFTALCKVKEKYPEIKLKLFDVGPLKQKVEELIKRNNLTENIELMGWQPPAEIKKYLDQASVFVLSSNHEGWSLVVLEALSRGCPVVMTDTGCAGEIVIDGKTGYVVPVGQAEILAQKIIKTLDNYDDSLEMALAGRKLVEKDIDLNNIKNQLTKMFKETV